MEQTANIRRWGGMRVMQTALALEKKVIHFQEWLGTQSGE
jgi:hypothetical protein